MIVALVRVSLERQGADETMKLPAGIKSAPAYLLEIIVAAQNGKDLVGHSVHRDHSPKTPVGILEVTGQIASVIDGLEVTEHRAGKFEC